ncbi:MAG TPA: cupin domain-containing protein [Allosphingosinicella sp.]|nr:cupin domain-containing protein [Allosphingosinicella sp.]
MDDAPRKLDLICADFNGALTLLRGLGARLDSIFPADEPHSAMLSHDGTAIRLRARADAPAPQGPLPDFRPEFVLTSAGAEAAEGRAGMLYRDLIPSRLGGRYIASHIVIAEGGPVADWVHFHRIAVQLICVRKGWVRVVYQDQGPPFVMHPGDMVLQPPGIRHRVLESGDGLEVVEITCPALHETFAEHDMTLPNGSDPGGLYGGQHFLHHVAATTPWAAWNGGEAQSTRVGQATGGIAAARIVRPGALPAIDVPPHDGELVFGFVLEGSARLQLGGEYPLGPGDSFAIPPEKAWRMHEASQDFRLLHVATARIPA